MGIINGRFREYKLKNGLVVALQNTPTQTVASKLRINYGSSHERDGEEGMAHFLEHCLVTGGSRKYDPVTADHLREAFGSFNAFTNMGRLNFVSKMLTEDLEKWLDYVSEHILNPRFDMDRVNGERERVLREISDAKSAPAYLHNSEFKSIFYRGHPKGRFVLGKEEVVKNANQELIRNFHARGFHPNNIDILLVGGLPDNTEELIENYFGSSLKGENTRMEFPTLMPLTQKSIIERPAPERYNADNPDESSAQIFLAFTAPIESHLDTYSVRTMSHILGGGTNSLLFQNVGLEKGLAYHLGSSYNGTYNCGEIHVEGYVPAKRIEEAVCAIFRELDRMKDEKVDNRVVERIRRKVKYNLASTYESNDGHIGVIEAKLDDNITPETFIQGFDDVSPERVLEVANRYLPNREKGNYVLFIRNPLMSV